ncbi:hypothetical protein GCM10012275_28620 [Longimycelium tulufanense]|uniref:Uncharacterized protein n=1 Tax=Longimycelium tulufanense TaxID=907463 RepID=A0A8J3FUK1_9PSEU|nr:hypothetical protein [Longimycelium tulufanense]GGM55792.1 hypothetical protein GCM10012275_28620 [Longimycelium tulufanense]
MIIGLSGYAQVGKDTVGSILIEHAVFERVSFADKVREVALAINPDICFDYWHSNLRQLVETKGWEEAKKIEDVRRFLQRLGTEAIREHLGEDAWVNAALPDYREYCSSHAGVVVTDVRFPNEAARIKDLDGEVWRVERPGYGPVNNHPSETAMDEWPFDRHIRNDGSLEDLKWSVFRAYMEMR